MLIEEVDDVEYGIVVEFCIGVILMVMGFLVDEIVLFDVLLLFLNGVIKFEMKVSLMFNDVFVFWLFKVEFINVFFVVEFLMLVSLEGVDLVEGEW